MDQPTCPPKSLLAGKLCPEANTVHRWEEKNDKDYCVQMAPGRPVTGPGTLIHHSSPALPTVPVTLRDGHLNGALPGAVADVTASHRVEVEGIQLTDLTMRPDCVGWAETLACHLFTKASATITSCQGIKRHRMRVGLHKPWAFP